MPTPVVQPPSLLFFILWQAHRVCIRSWRTILSSSTKKGLTLHLFLRNLVSHSRTALALAIWAIISSLYFTRVYIINPPAQTSIMPSSFVTAIRVEPVSWNIHFSSRGNLTHSIQVPRDFLSSSPPLPQSPLLQLHQIKEVRRTHALIK